MANETNTQRGGLHAYTIQCAAGKNTKRTIRGCTIRVADSPCPIDITVHNKKLNGGKGTAFTLTMKKFEKWFTDIEYDEIEIFNSSASDISVTLQLGYGDFVAEIISRTLAAQSIVTKNFAPRDDDDTPIHVASGGFREIEIAPENLQRKRINWQLNWENAGIGAGTLEVMWGQAGVATYAEVRALAPLDASSLTPVVNQSGSADNETTAALSLYLVEVSEGAGPVDVNLRIATYEEVYSAA